MLRSVLTVLVFLAFAVPASANTFGFECLTSARACPAGEPAIELDVLAGGPDQVQFVLRHVGAMFQLGAVYFEVNGLLDGILAVTNSVDVGFIATTSASGPPGGGGTSWGDAVTTTASSGRGTGSEYLHPGESLLIIASLASGITAQDVIDAIADGLFTVGIKLGDDGLVTIPVPEPTLLGLLGIAGLAYAGRRRMV